MSAADRNRTVIRRWLEDLWNGRDLDVADEIFAERYVRRGSTELRGPSGVKEMARAYFAAFPDLEFRLDDMVAENDTVAVRYTARGTMRGPLLGLAPTHRSASISGMDFFLLQQGKIVESWPCFDELGMLGKLGLLPKLILKDAAERYLPRKLRGLLR